MCIRDSSVVASEFAFDEFNPFGNMRTPARFAFVIAEKLVTLIFSFTENVPRLLFDVSRTVNLFPDTSPCAD